MNEKTRTALEESIEHWQEIERGEGVDCGTYTCALCWEFNNEPYQMCNGCPVSAKMNLSGCIRTPYDAWDAAQECLGRETFTYDRVADTPELVRLARAERKFLESLREQK